MIILAQGVRCIGAACKSSQHHRGERGYRITMAQSAIASNRQPSVVHRSRRHQRIWPRSKLRAWYGASWNGLGVWCGGCWGWSRGLHGKWFILHNLYRYGNPVMYTDVQRECLDLLIVCQLNVIYFNLWRQNTRNKNVTKQWYTL